LEKISENRRGGFFLTHTVDNIVHLFSFIVAYRIRKRQLGQHKISFYDRWNAAFPQVL